MKKLVIKTALITLASIVALMAILFGVFALFFPKTLATSFDKAGSYGASMYFYEKQYEKSSSMDDLYTLCVKVNPYTDGQRAEKYLTEFAEKSNFYSYCRNLDSGEVVSNEEYFEGKLVTVLYLKGGVDAGIPKAIQFIREGNKKYTEYNPFFMLYSDDNIDWTTEQRKLDLGNIFSAIGLLCDNGNGEAELDFYEMDIALNDMDMISSIITNS